MEPERRVDYLNVDYGVRSWLLTTDHKRIALLYLASITLMFCTELSSNQRRPWKYCQRSQG